MVYGLLRALPGDRLVDTVNGEKLRPLDAGTEASGPHGLAVRKTALSSEAQPASTASRTNVRDDRDTPLKSDGMNSTYSCFGCDVKKNF